MERTQISLTTADMRSARAEAKRLGVSFAELVRRALRAVVPVDEGKPWMRFAGMVESEDPRSSERIDDVVYGTDDPGA